jgi:hypothetical protein
MEQSNRPPRKIRVRAEFSQAIKRTLSQRVGLLCSNPTCLAPTTGPQSDPSNVINLGVAAHITAAARGGPRFDPSMSGDARVTASNGIWLCQSCAKLIDSDVAVYRKDLLHQWKTRAEQEAKARLGRTKRIGSSQKHSVTSLKRDLKMRDHLHRDLLKSTAQRMELPRVTGRSAKFAHSEVIIRRIDDRTYPNVDDSPGISGWFKLEVLDFYPGGINCILNLKYALVDSATRKWALLTDEQSESSFEPSLTKVKVFITGKIPWRNILHYDMDGDQFYREPHLYCNYADDGKPYEAFGYFIVGPGHEWELQPGEKIGLEALLAEVPRN